jgi:hypothetical protein
VEHHALVVGVTTDEMIGPAAVTLGVLERVDFIRRWMFQRASPRFRVLARLPLIVSEVQ